MRDFRHAKAMAHTLRASLAARGFKVSVSQSLELIAEAFGVADWNTLAAAIRAQAARSAKADPRALVAAAGGAAFSAALKSTVRQAIAYADRRKHQYATLEHLLLALIDDAHAAAVMTACAVDLETLRKHLLSYIDDDLKTLTIDEGASRATAAFQRVIQRAAIAVQSSAHAEVTGAHVLVAIFAERESHAVYFLQEQEMTRHDAVNYVGDGRAQGDGDIAHGDPG